MLFGCNKTGTTSTGTVLDSIDTTLSKVIGSGTFISAPGESVSGRALLLSNVNSYSLALENFKTANGPDLYLFISKQISPNTIIDLGRLKSTNGNQVYALAMPININDYKYVLIYCKQYNVLFGSAELK